MSGISRRNRKRVGTVGQRAEDADGAEGPEARLALGPDLDLVPGGPLQPSQNHRGRLTGPVLPLGLWVVQPSVAQLVLKDPVLVL